MIYYTMPRKGFQLFPYRQNEGFFIEGKEQADCFEQLREWAKSNSEKWIFYFDCGAGVAYPIPICRHIFEVKIFDSPPDGIVVGMLLYQRGRKRR